MHGHLALYSFQWTSVGRVEIKVPMCQEMSRTKMRRLRIQLYNWLEAHADIEIKVENTCRVVIVVTRCRHTFPNVRRTVTAAR
jgi:hypothetical protein